MVTLSQPQLFQTTDLLALQEELKKLPCKVEDAGDQGVHIVWSKGRQPRAYAHVTPGAKPRVQLFLLDESSPPRDLGGLLARLFLGREAWRALTRPAGRPAIA